ncbi:hypothetical protein MASR1M68_15590 [Elusimicrobiota bacterium]
MNKLVCLFIALVMLLGSVSGFAGVKSDVCADCFGEFVVVQIQKNFAQTISTIPQQDNKTPENLTQLYILNSSLQDNFYKKSADNCKFISKDFQQEHNVLFFNDIRRCQWRHQGLNAYLMKLNSFMAINAVNDENTNTFFYI